MTKNTLAAALMVGVVASASEVPWHAKPATNGDVFNIVITTVAVLFLGVAMFLSAISNRLEDLIEARRKRGEGTKA